MKILALDQSTRITGYAVFDDATLITHGRISLTDKELPVRLVKIRQKIQEIIQQYEIDQVVMEDIQLENSVMNNVKTFKGLSEVYGVLQELFEEIKIPYEAIYASTWKYSTGIRSRMRADQKKEAIELAQQRFGKIVSEDEADALGIGIYWIDANLNKENKQPFSWNDH